MQNKFFLVAEGCCNHCGDIEIAKKMIRSAAVRGIHYLKWQKRTISSISDHIKNKPHPIPENSYGKTYEEHRQNLEFSIEQHRELKEYSEKHGIGYACSVWDIPSAKEIVGLDPDYIKIPSALNLNKELIFWLLKNYSKKIHLSLGMLSPPQKDFLLQEIFKYKDYIRVSLPPPPSLFK